MALVASWKDQSSRWEELATERAEVIRELKLELGRPDVEEEER